MAAERSREPRWRRRARGNCRRGLLGGKERCEAKVRQMVADNEDVETQGGGGAGCTPAGLATEGVGKVREGGGEDRRGLAQWLRVTFNKNTHHPNVTNIFASAPAEFTNSFCVHSFGVA